MAIGMGCRCVEVEDQTARRCIACSSPKWSLVVEKVRNQEWKDSRSVPWRMKCSMFARSGLKLVRKHVTMRDENRARRISCMSAVGRRLTEAGSCVRYVCMSPFVYESWRYSGRFLSNALIPDPLSRFPAFLRSRAAQTMGGCVRSGLDSLEASES